MTARISPDLVVTRCTDCGWTSKRTTTGRAQYALHLHSCDRHRAEKAATERGRARAAAVDRTPRPCQHPRARHQHGTHACYVLDACRCLRCAVANSQYEHDRLRQRAYGIDAYVDAAPAREHVQQLRAAGMGYRRIALVAGVTSNSVSTLLYGRPGSAGLTPRQQIRPALAAALLAVPVPGPVGLAPGAVTDPTGTRRRLQALVAMGWSVARIAAHSGVNRQRLDAALVGRRRILVRTAAAIARAYDDLWDAVPPKATKGQRIAKAKAQSRAERNGWLSPMAWDDDTIDDPDAQPHTGTTRSLRALDLDEWLFLVRGGVHPAEAASRCGASISGVEMAARRHNRRDVLDHVTGIRAAMRRTAA